MICKYFRKRSKDLKPYFYCTLKRRQVIFTCYENCLKWQPRENKGIKKVSKKRIVVSDKTYQEVFKRDNGICQLCASPYNLEYHHILYRSERKDLIDKASNGIMLCNECHRKVHSNKHKWQPILQKIVEGKNV